MDRFARQMKLAEVGPAGQARLGAAVVDVPLEGFSADVCVRYLAGAGIGCVRVRDGSLIGAVRAIAPEVRVEVDSSLSAAPVATPALSLADPAARELAAGALHALRAIREALLPAPAGANLGRTR